MQKSIKFLISEANLTSAERDKLSEIIEQLENSSKMHGEQAKYIKRMLEKAELKEQLDPIRKIIREAASETLVNEVQKFVDGNQFLRGSVVEAEDLIETDDYVVYASDEGLKHTKDRHTDANAPGSLINSGVDLRSLIMSLASTSPTSSGGMVKWEGVKSPSGPIGKMGLAVADPKEVADMKDYTMPGGRGETVKIAPGERKPTDQVTLVTAKLGDLTDGRTALSLVTLYPGGMDVDGVTVPNDRNAFAAAGIYFVLPPESPTLKEAKLVKNAESMLRRIIRESMRSIVS